MITYEDWLRFLERRKKRLSYIKREGDGISIVEKRFDGEIGTEIQAVTVASTTLADLQVEIQHVQKRLKFLNDVMNYKETK